MINTSIGTLQTETPFQVLNTNEVPSFKKVVQKGFSKKEPNPMNFKQLPREVLEEIGETTRVGSARLELAILAHLCKTRARTACGEVQYEQGFTVQLREGEFIQTQETTAEDIYCRWHTGIKRADLYKLDGSRTRQFDAFYKRVQRAFKRLMLWDWIVKVDYVNPKFRGIYGTIWKLDSRLELCLDRLPDCPEPPPVLMGAKIDLGGTYVNAVDRTGQHFLSESADEFIAAKCATSVYDHGTFYRHDEWCEVVAENKIDQPRHVSVGAFRKDDVKWVDEETPCTVPWVILEPEDGDLFDRYNSTVNMLEVLQMEGVDLSSVMVTFSGNKSFHIRIPQGMFGNPVYRSVEDCMKVLRRFAYENFEERIDLELLDPRHLVRCTGSLHEQGSRVTAFRGSDFVTASFEVTMSQIQEGTWAKAHKLSPRHFPVDPWLSERLIDASDSFSRFWIPQSCDVSTDPKINGAFAAALKGCGENEQWHEKHTGRNKLVFVAACYLLKKYDEVTAFAELEKVNQKNDPPLPDKEVQTCFESAQRTIARKTR